MTVRYLLDTNICIYIAKKRPMEVYQRLSELSIGDIGMSLITFGELRFGAEKSQHQEIALYRHNKPSSKHQAHIFAQPAPLTPYLAQAINTLVK